MELLCIEAEFEPRGYLDPVFLDDKRVLTNLLVTEGKYTVATTYFNSIQREIHVYMRNTVCSWMLEVCEEEKCQDEVFPLAINIMDRYLSQVAIRKKELQLLGTVSLFLSSKLRQTVALDADKLVNYTDNSITSEDLLNWEMLVLTQLKWDLSAITPNDFVNPLLRRLGNDDAFVKNNEVVIKRHTQTLISFCAVDFEFLKHRPSMVAAACISTSILGLQGKSQWHQQQTLLQRLRQLTNIEMEPLRVCQKQIESMIASLVRRDVCNKTGLDVFAVHDMPSSSILAKG